MIRRPWAFWRRVQYLTGLLFIVFLIIGGVSFAALYQTPTCFDGAQNSDELGIDCGGSCVRVCASDVLAPQIQWAKTFRVTDSQYNAVAYIENTNTAVGAPEVGYTFKLFDDDGLITERSGTTALPPDNVYPIFEGRIDTASRVPTRTTIELQPIELWLPASAGREQFVVESRELKNVDSSPRLDASITNTALTEAKDVEIVATIFDTNRNALTSSRTVVPFFGSRTTQSIVFTWPEPIAKTLRSCEVPTDVILAVDLSGSMNDDGGSPPQPITAVLRAAEAFVDRLNKLDRAAIVSYATNAELRSGLTADKAAVRAQVQGLSIDPKEESGSTNTGEALIRAHEELSSERHNSNARKVLVLLSDGLATAPRDDPEPYALDAAKNLKETDTEVFTVGLGEKVNEEFLREISSGGGYYFKAASADTVDKIYRSITEAICEDGPAIVEIVPKTSASFAPLQ